MAFCYSNVARLNPMSLNFSIKMLIQYISESNEHCLIKLKMQKTQHNRKFCGSHEKHKGGTSTRK